MKSTATTIIEQGVKIPETEEILYIKPIFPLRKTKYYESLKSKGDIVEVDGFETTKFMFENGYFKYYKSQISEGLEKVKESKKGTQQSARRTYTPVKQSRDDNEARTCVVASTANIYRAFGKNTTEEELLNKLNDTFTENGTLPIGAFTAQLEQAGFSKKYISDKSPTELVEAIQQGFVVQAVWEDHTRVISGMFNNEDGETYLIVNDPLPNQPEAYAVSLQELYAVPLSWDNLTLTGYKLDE